MGAGDQSRGQRRQPAPVRVLPAPLADQIAAGEVIERPASVLKELVENSLDAGAGSVRVEAEGGGVALLRVRDDGCGIAAADLARALERHATSKIASLADLERVRTMGFRGEALPSIASVSRLELTSCAAGSGQAARLRVEGGVVGGAPEPVAHPPGTTVTVRDLFFNTPARRKFLRTERTELRHLEACLRRLALADFAVSLRLEHGGRTLLELPAARAPAARERRVARVCGTAFLKAALGVDFEAEGLRVHGWLAGPALHRAQADGQHFYVNGRMVRDSLARHAVRQAYADLLPAGRHPLYLLFLEIDPQAVDVNVHPAKHEVRFREARLVHDFLHRSLRRALAETVALPGLEAPLEGLPAPGPAAPPGSRPGPGEVREQLAAYGALHPPARARAPSAGGGRSGWRFLARCHGDLALLERDGVPRVLALGAALVWRARRRLERALAGGGEVARRPLLVPLAIEVGEGEAEAAEAAAEPLARLGVELRRVAPAVLSLRRVPAPLAEVPGEALARALIAPLAAGSGEEALLEALAGAAAEAAPGLEGERVQALLEELEALGAGRAERLWTDLSRADLERLLGRGR